MRDKTIDESFTDHTALHGVTTCMLEVRERVLDVEIEVTA